MNGMFDRGRHGWTGRRELAALAGMAAGSAVDFARLGPLGIAEICGDPNAALFARLGAHGFGYAGMLIAIALAQMAWRRDSGWRAAFHAFAMCAGMVAADMLAPGLPLRLTPALSLLSMILGMACGSLIAHALRGSGEACDRGERWV